MPSLIILGEFDTGLGGRQHLAELYRLIRTDNKLRFTVRNQSISSGTTSEQLYTLLTKFVEENLPTTQAARAALP